MEMIINFNAWIIMLGAIVIAYRVCDTVEKVCETKAIAKYGDMFGKHEEEK